MSDLVFDDPCVLFALRRESAPFLREFRPHERVAGAPCWARFCGPAWLTVLAAETGSATEAALDWLLSAPVLEKVPYRPKLVLSAGFATALTSDAQTGDIILATEVFDAAGKCWPTSWPGELPPGAWRPPIQRGRLLTLPQPVAQPQALLEQHQALAVDTTAATVARLCSQRNVPFGCVRTILQPRDAAVSLLAPLLAGRRPSPLTMLRAPRAALALHRQTRHAASQLGAALGELLTLTLPGGREL